MCKKQDELLANRQRNYELAQKMVQFNQKDYVFFKDKHGFYRFVEEENFKNECGTIIEILHFQ